MATVDLIPPDPAHAPTGPRQQGLLYPLWVLRLEIRPYPGAEPRSIHFSVDAMRSIPLPVVGMPEVVSQDVPEGARILSGVSQAQAEHITRHFARKGLGWLGGRIARMRVVTCRMVYKLFWVVPEGDTGRSLVDSRSGTRIPLPADWEEPAIPRSPSSEN